MEIFLFINNHQSSKLLLPTYIFHKSTLCKTRIPFKPFYFFTSKCYVVHILINPADSHSQISPRAYPQNRSSNTDSPVRPSVPDKVVNCQGPNVDLSHKIQFFLPIIPCKSFFDIIQHIKIGQALIISRLSNSNLI